VKDDDGLVIELDLAFENCLLTLEVLGSYELRTLFCPLLEMILSILMSLAFSGSESVPF
jgi:hypothetical protein